MPIDSGTLNTPGSQTITIPTGCDRISLYVRGAGGSGGLFGVKTGTSDNWGGGGGGGGGTFRYQDVVVSGGQQITVHVGRGGYANVNGGQGDASTIVLNGIKIAYGGGGGRPGVGGAGGGYTASGAQGGYSGGNGATGDLDSVGTPAEGGGGGGGAVDNSAGSNASTAAGASSGGGNGGLPPPNSPQASAGQGNTGGGGGGQSGGTTKDGPCNGADGQIRYTVWTA